MLPLFGISRSIVEELLTANASRAYLFSNTEKTHLWPETMSDAVSGIFEKLMQSGQILAPFDLGDLRRTCETMMARMGVPKEIRAQLQSHGLGGVQNRHYDRHGYTDEKCTALRTWHKKLKSIRVGRPAKSNVISLKASRSA